MQSLKDMEYLLNAIREVDDAMRDVKHGQYNKEIKEILIDALNVHKHRIIEEYEIRHNSGVRT